MMAARKTARGEYLPMGGTSTADVFRAVLTLLDWQQQIVQDALGQIERAGAPSGRTGRRQGKPRPSRK